MRRRVPAVGMPEEHRIALSLRARAAVVVTALACVAATAVLGARRDAPAAASAPVLVVGLLFVGAGAVTSARRPASVSGQLLTVAGLVWLLSAVLTASANPVLFTAGLALFAVGLAPLGHLAVVFPGRRPSSRLERLLVAAPYALAVASLPVVGTASCSDCPIEPIGLDVAGGVGRLWYSALLVAVLVTTAGMITLLVRRWRGATPVARRVLLPVVPGAVFFSLAYVAGILAELGLPTGLGPRWGLVGLVLIAAAPVVFLGGLLRSHLARAGVGELVVELGEAAPSSGLREGLARALGDPTLELGYWAAGSARYVAPDGTALDVAAAGPGRSVALVERGGRRVGALVYDAALRDDPALVDAVAAAAGLAIENERLHAEVLARLEEVRASRTRIVGAADTARRQVERDLHDGAQQRLVALTLAVGMARTQAGAAADPALADLLQQASEEARLALHELRELAQGLHPAVLTEAGLGAALEALAERAPVPVDLAVGVEGRLPAPVEVAAYYVVSEALANVAKHAQASAVTVRVDRRGDWVRVEVADDGVGGAAVRPGSGLEGLADRVAALDGGLEIDSPPGHGTRLRVDLPCG